MNATEMNSVEIQLLKEQVQFLREKIQKSDIFGILNEEWNEYPTVEKDFERIAKQIESKKIGGSIQNLGDQRW